MATTSKEGSSAEVVGGLADALQLGDAARNGPQNSGNEKKNIRFD